MHTGCRSSYTVTSAAPEGPTIAVFHQDPAGPDPLKKLSEELHQLAERFAERKVTLREVMDVLGARASGLLIIILALPFCAPISIPGLSVPFGIVILFIAARFALGLPPWLPAKLLATQLPPRFFRAVLEGASKFIGWIEKQLNVIGMLGMMERDGVAIAAAYGLLVVTICYLGFFAGVMIELIKRAQHWLMG